MKTQYLLIAFVLLSVIGCKRQPPEPTELYDSYRNSVVLIRTSYYFKTTLDNGFKFFYTVEDGQPNFYDTEEEAKENVGVSYGTGFFISSTGEIATNRHVVFPTVETTVLNKAINTYLSEIKYKIRSALDETEIEKSKLADFYRTYSSYMDYNRRSEMRDDYLSKEKQINQLEEYIDKLRFDPDNTKTEIERIFLGVAFDDSHVTNDEDFVSCVATKKSSTDEVDLAIIQLKNKTTPPSVKKLFSIEMDSKEKLKLNDPVYMIGFNHGMELAKTENGIKSQFTQGTVTQDPDQRKVLYSIPTLPGSSGSPVIDKWGNLIAINFAKTGDYQGFSFGIPSLALSNLYNGKANIATETQKEVAAEVPEVRQASFSELETKDYRSTIKSFLQAEEDRDFDEIYSFFSPDFKRYYDIKSPTYAKVKNRYEYLWGFVSNAHNEVKSIDKVNDFTYDLHTNYSYYNQKKGESFEKYSTVRFMFDSRGKIVELY